MRKTLRKLAEITLLGLVIFFLIQNYIDYTAASYVKNIDEIPSSQAVMVLGAFVYEDTPSPVLQDRLDYALEVYQAGKAKKILVSGDHGTADYDEVNAMKNYLLKKGVPAEDIFSDHAGFNTYDSMYRARDIFEIKSLIISTQRFHITRSVYLARNLGIDAYGYPSPDKVAYHMEYLNLRESFAKGKAFLDVHILQRKPRFLGEKLPITGDGRITDDKTKFDEASK